MNLDIDIQNDMYQYQRMIMDENAGFLIKRELKIKMISEKLLIL